MSRGPCIVPPNIRGLPLLDDMIAAAEHFRGKANAASQTAIVECLLNKGFGFNAITDYLPDIMRHLGDEVEDQVA